MQETGVWSLGWEDPLEKEMATHSSILAWRIPQTEEPGGLQSRGHKESDTTERLHFPLICIFSYFAFFAHILEIDLYSWLLNNLRIRGTDPLHSGKSEYNL